uniref:Uncharacterized protein n=1 Tax=Eutreptiella gymnastica TaxID=73025 RepID=A0A7S4LGQ7_9EUGL
MTISPDSMPRQAVRDPQYDRKECTRNIPKPHPYQNSATKSSSPALFNFFLPHALPSDGTRSGGLYAICLCAAQFDSPTPQFQSIHQLTSEWDDSQRVVGLQSQPKCCCQQEQLSQT